MNLAACLRCGKTGSAVQHERLNPRNLLPESALLCTPCGKKLGYVKRYGSKAPGRGERRGG